MAAEMRSGQYRQDTINPSHRQHSPESDIVLRLPNSDEALDRAERDLSVHPDGIALDQPLSLSRPWLDEPAPCRLDAAYRLTAREGRVRIRAHLDGAAVYLDEPVRLVTTDIAKPWGREIWYTGIEARGESRVETDTGELPLSSYLALAPQRLCRHAPLVLLKVLDPRPEPVLGDLYFETHERKQEVYLVTHVDRRAWPDGAGRIRFGMNQALRRRYGDDASFRRDYLQAVRGYETIRRAIDAGQPVAAEQEAAARAAMDAFTELRPLGVGDVVVVPTWVPHSLQHGVRVIEFQTPTYERYIISFAQRVLTQDHWDTDTAVARMQLDTPPPPSFQPRADGAEEIVAFDDFRVWRVRLAPDARFTLPDHPSYALCMVVHGEVRLGPLALTAEQAAFVPALALSDPTHRPHQAVLHNPAGAPTTVLIAAPDL
jgi:hypothetical protein